MEQNKSNVNKSKHKTNKIKIAVLNKINRISNLETRSNVENLQNE